jgi:23S rRNA (pseudouridine1915-N3)-methyltransferase
MKITIIQVGKTRQSYFQEAEAEYLKRLQPYAAVKIITLKEASAPYDQNESTRAVAKQKEALEIQRHIPADTFLIALDEHGKTISSVQFADFLRKKRDFEGANITFIIGGPFGLAEQILKQARLILSFSPMTFTHEMIRTILLEQIYRAFTIISGKKYHY